MLLAPYVCFHIFNLVKVTDSPADIQLDPEMWFKLFFLVDSCCLDVTIKESD